MSIKLQTYERRALAYLIDITICYFISLSISGYGIFTFLSDLEFYTLFQIQLYLPFIIYGILITIITYIFNGYTIGSVITRTKIVDTKKNRSHITFIQALLRSLLLSIFTLVIANFFYMMINNTTKTVIDTITNTDIQQ